MSELIYYLSKGIAYTEVVMQCEVLPDNSLLLGSDVTARELRVTYSVPDKIHLMAWQSMVVDAFPDVHWNANIKVGMKQEGDFSRPSMKALVGQDRTFWLEHRGTVNFSFDYEAYKKGKSK